MHRDASDVTTQAAKLACSDQDGHQSSLPSVADAPTPPLALAQPLAGCTTAAQAALPPPAGHARAPTPPLGFVQPNPTAAPSDGRAGAPTPPLGFVQPWPTAAPSVYPSPPLHMHIAYAQYATPPTTPPLAAYPQAWTPAEQLLLLPFLIEPLVQAPCPSSLNAAGQSSYETVVINLKTRDDRLCHMRAQLAAAQLSSARFEAQCGADAPEWAVAATWDSTLNSRFDTKTLPHPRLAMTPGERGCAMSHAVLWAALARQPDGAPPLLILEDDVQLLTPAFGAETAALVGYVETALAPHEREAVLYLGADVPSWSQRAPYPVLPARELREADYAWQTSSYLLWPAAARKLVGALPIDCPVDNFLSKFFVGRGLRALVALPNMAAQTSPYRDGDIMHSNVFRPPVEVDPRLRQGLGDSQASVGGGYLPGPLLQQHQLSVPVSSPVAGMAAAAHPGLLQASQAQA